MYVMRLGCPYTAHVAGHTDILIPQRGYLGAYISVTPGLRVRGRGRFFTGVSLNGPVTPLRMRETYELRMTIHKIIFIRTKSPWKRQNCAYTYRIEPMSSVWVAYRQRMASVWPANVSKCQRMTSVCQRMSSMWPAYGQRTLRMASVWVAYETIYVSDTSDIR